MDTSIGKTSLNAGESTPDNIETHSLLKRPISLLVADLFSKLLTPLKLLSAKRPKPFNIEELDSVESASQDPSAHKSTTPTASDTLYPPESAFNTLTMPPSKYSVSYKPTTNFTVTNIEASSSLESYRWDRQRSLSNTTDSQTVSLTNTSFSKKSPTRTNKITEPSIKRLWSPTAWAVTPNRANYIPSSTKSSQNGSVSYHLGNRVSKKRATNGLSYIRNHIAQRGNQAQTSLLQQYISGYTEATRSGFQSSASDFVAVESYLKQVRVGELAQETEASKQLAVKSLERKARLENAVSQSRSTPKPKYTPSKHTALSTTFSDTEWIQSLRRKVEQSSKSLSDIRTSEIQTPIFDSLLAKDSLQDEMIKKLKLQKNQQAIVPLSKEAQMKVEDAMSPGVELLVQGFSVSICKKDIHTLKGSSWLNDEIINFYGQLCMKRSKDFPEKYPKIHIFNTFFYEKLRTQGYSSVRRWTKKVDLFSIDLIIIPIHIGMHWTCAAINFKASQFEYYDSLLGDNYLCLELLRDYLIQESNDKKKKQLDLDNWENWIPKNIPTQQNGYDCGVFTCTFMEFLSRQAPFTFSQEDMGLIRRRIAYEILTMNLLTS
ncbi:hypothetical protein BDV3_004546 [Batrachochytrium dendrobatidis]|nr:hypothetical protein BDEG_23017 [Batrachochytrium dendrobatidis JEL423]